MRSKQRGFTLIELMIVVTIIATIAAIAIPNLIAARMNSNESAAIATLKTIASAQAQLQANASVDTNSNGAGEYGYFAELAGGVGVRDNTGTASTNLLRPAILSGAFKNVFTEPAIWGGMVVRSGYCFMIYLPHVTKVGLPEYDTGGVNLPPPDANLSESLWCCYAWPLSHGNSGRRAFFVNQQGDVLFTRNNLRRYSGGTMPAYWYSAYKYNVLNYMGGTTAVGSTGWDQQRWTAVN